MDYTAWEQTSVNPLSILLDDENPRIEAGAMNQPEIRELLLRHEGVSKLAQDIVRTGGLFPHDLLIISAINDQMRVLEGNRRIAALQMLLDPTLIPQPFKDSFPRATQVLKDSIEAVPAIVVPDRASADHLIAQIHAFSARKGWSPLAKYRYAHSRFGESESVEQIASDLGSDVAEVRKFIRSYNIYRTVLALDWTPEEQSVLRGDNVAVTPLLYPFERTSVKDLVGEIFDAEGRRNVAYN